VVPHLDMPEWLPHYATWKKLRTGANTVPSRTTITNSKNP
jgi:hypothetical protein